MNKKLIRLCFWLVMIIVVALYIIRYSTPGKSVPVVSTQTSVPYVVTIVPPTQPVTHKVSLPLVSKSMYISFLPFISRSTGNKLETLVWSDDFDGNQLDPDKWNIRIGAYDPDYHTKENITIENGNLVITARRQNLGGLHYTTGWITTKQNWLYGRFEMRAKLPTGKGLWPAFWMLSQSNVYGEGVMSGEIDIMELWGDRPQEIKGTLHYGYPWVFVSTPYDLRSGSFSNEYHVFSVEWEKDIIRWYVDGHLYKKETRWYSSGGIYPAPFDQSFYVILNVGIWRENPPDKYTIFPEQMTVDYVRVYQ